MKFSQWMIGIGLWVSSSLSSKVMAAAFPFHTEGRSIVGSDGQAVQLKAVNWYGANLEGQVAHGLEKKTSGQIAKLIGDLGYNSVRLTYSNAMLHDKNPVNPDTIRANPGFMGMTPLQVFDEVVESLAAEGLAIILNNHSTTSVWCCGYDVDGLWHFSGNKTGRNQTEEQWIDDWKMLAERYKHIPEVVGADLRNEVRTAKWGDTILPLSPNWGSGDGNDWARAAERAGNNILDVNSKLLIIVEGINWTGTLGAFGAYRPHLVDVVKRPIQFKIPGRLVYAAHNYGYIGPKHNGDETTSSGQTRYRDMDEKTFYETIEKEWGYVVEPGKFYTAPLMVSEFGAHFETAGDADKVWFKRLVNYMAKKKLHFAYWPLNPEGYGLVDKNWKKRVGDWREDSFNQLLAIEPDSPSTLEKFENLNIQKSSHALSKKFGDWNPGANKGTCGEDTRLVGLSRDHRGLCSNAGGSSSWSEKVTVVTTETADEDWAGGFTKLTCPSGSMVIGYSKLWWGTSGALCMKANEDLGESCRTLWFDRGDNLSSASGGDFAKGSYKGQCANDEYIGGIAHKAGWASALRCCQ